MKLVMSSVVTLFCVSATTLWSSCKKNPDVMQENPSVNNINAFTVPGTFKKEITLPDASGQDAITLLVSGNDEQAVQSITKDRFMLTATGKYTVASPRPQQVAGTDNPLPMAPADENKVVYIGIKPATTAAAREVLAPLPWFYSFNLNAPAGVLTNPIRFYTESFGRGLLLRKQTLSSPFAFGVSTHLKVIGIVVQPFGGPVGTPGAVYGNTGYPVLSAGTTPGGIYCNMLLTELARTTVDYQSFQFSAAAWAL
jgi:hypothetical protein